MRKLFKERKLFKGGNYMRKYGSYCQYVNQKKVYETQESAAELSLDSTKLSQNCVGLSYVQQN